MHDLNKFNDIINLNSIQRDRKQKQKVRRKPSSINKKKTKVKIKQKLYASPVSHSFI